MNVLIACAQIVVALTAVMVGLVVWAIVLRHNERKAANAHRYAMWLERDPMPPDRVLAAAERELRTEN